MVVANRVIGRSDRFQRRLSSQGGREMASRVNREVYARFCGRLEVKFLRPTRRIRKFRDGKLLIVPEKAKVLAHLRRIKAYLDQNKQAPVGKVVRDLAPVIRGWTAYYRHACSARTFQYADHRVWQMLWAWARRRHPTKSKGWVKARYFRPTRSRVWNFADAS